MTMDMKSTREILVEDENNKKFTIEWNDFRDKEWIGVDDIINMLRNWNCQNNPKIQTVINTVMMRIRELEKTNTGATQ